MKKEKKDKKIEVRITDDMFTTLSRVSDKNESSIGAIVRVALKEYLRQHEDK